MSKGERAEDWLPESVARKRRKAGAGAPSDAMSWIEEERRLRAKRLSRELSDWVTELRTRSEAIDSRLRNAETTE